MIEAGEAMASGDPRFMPERFGREVLTGTRDE